MRLLRSVRCQRTVLQCREPDDKLWLEDVLRHAELTSAKFGTCTVLGSDKNFGAVPAAPQYEPVPCCALLAHSKETNQSIIMVLSEVQVRALMMDPHTMT